MNSINILVKSLDHLYPGNPEQEDSNSKQDVDHGNCILEKSSTSINNSLIKDNDNEKNGEVQMVGEQLSNTQKIVAPNSFFHNLLWNTLRIMFFIPNYLLLKPLTFTWLLITYPFTHFFENDIQNADGMILNSTGRPEAALPSQQDVDEKTELLKQENIISNTIKSPSSSSVYMIPPPQRLYPLSRNPGRRRKKKTLILDLDETLIHSLSRGSPRSFNSASSQLHMIEIKLNNISTLYYVHKRPFCDFFLKEISKVYELQIFTASVKEYADPIIDWLETNIIDLKNSQHSNSKIFTKRYYRSDCTFRQGVGYIKDLSKFFPREEDLKNVVILDNSPISYALHENNAVMIEGWINDQSDRDLLNLLPMLHSLSLCIDVRFILGLRGGEKIFER